MMLKTDWKIDKIFPLHTPLPESCIRHLKLLINQSYQSFSYYKCKKVLSLLVCNVLPSVIWLTRQATLNIACVFKAQSATSESAAKVESTTSK